MPRSSATHGAATVIGTRAGRGGDDGVAERAAKRVAVAGGAAAGVRLAAGGQDHARGARRPRCGVVSGEAGVAAAQVEQRLAQGQRGAAAVQAAQQGVEHVGGLVADGEDLAGLLDLGGDALGLEEVDGVLHAEGGEGGVEEPAGRTVGLDDAAVVGGVGDVAARAAGHEDLDAGLAVLLQQQGAPAALGGADRRHQPRGPGPDHDHVPEMLPA